VTIAAFDAAARAAGAIVGGGETKGPLGRLSLRVDFTRPWVANG